MEMRERAVHDTGRFLEVSSDAQVKMLVGRVTTSYTGAVGLDDLLSRRPALRRPSAICSRATASE
jgi:hypothetical protein